MAIESPIPVTVLTGFLGAGKTTLLNHLLRQPEMAGTAVMINEFGEIGLDHLLVETLEEDAILLQSGCLCCTIRGDLSAALVRLAERMEAGQPIRRVVLETTGLADPVPILQTLLADPAIQRHFVLAGVVTLVDAANGMATLDTQPEAVRQVAVADRLLVSKPDLVDAAALGSRGGPRPPRTTRGLGPQPPPPRAPPAAHQGAGGRATPGAGARGGRCWRGSGSSIRVPCRRWHRKASPPLRPCWARRASIRRGRARPCVAGSPQRPGIIMATTITAIMIMIMGTATTITTTTTGTMPASTPSA
jgi:Ni2+-binding GTPase involved in maturation of urease and hydrogenase